MTDMPKRIPILFLICLLSLASAGYTYSQWASTTSMYGTIHMACLEIAIDDQRSISDLTLDINKTPDNKILTISANITTGSELWIGMIIKNNGTTPAMITYTITTNDTLHEALFESETHLYGDYTTVPADKWEDITTPPPTGELSPPFDFPEDRKLVAWQKIALTEPPSEPFTIQITATYAAQWMGWQDELNVVYTLGFTYS